MDIDDIYNYLNDKRLKKLKQEEQRVYIDDDTMEEIEQQRIKELERNERERLKLIEKSYDERKIASDAVEKARILQEEFDRNNKGLCSIQKRGGHVFNCSSRNKFIK
jgi:hypothetical protein